MLLRPEWRESDSRYCDIVRVAIIPECMECNSGIFSSNDLLQFFLALLNVSAFSNSVVLQAGRKISAAGVV